MWGSPFAICGNLAWRERWSACVKKINVVRGVVEGPLSGYNETTTGAFLHLVEAVRQAYGELYPANTAAEFCDLHPELMNKHVLRFSTLRSGEVIPMPRRGSLSLTSRPFLVVFRRRPREGPLRRVPWEADEMSGALRIPLIL
jgi:hypothetical protein